MSKPKQFDVLVTPNLYGNIVENIGAGLVGGPGIVPGIDIGPNYAIFEPARVLSCRALAHSVQGTRTDQSHLAGTNTVNPTAYLLSAALMLHHIELECPRPHRCSALQVPPPRRAHQEGRVQRHCQGGACVRRCGPV